MYAIVLYFIAIYINIIFVSSLSAWNQSTMSTNQQFINIEYYVCPHKQSQDTINDIAMLDDLEVYSLLFTLEYTSIK